MSWRLLVRQGDLYPVAGCRRRRQRCSCQMAAQAATNACIRKDHGLLGRTIVANSAGVHSSVPSYLRFFPFLAEAAFFAGFAFFAGLAFFAGFVFFAAFLATAAGFCAAAFVAGGAGAGGDGGGGGALRALLWPSPCLVGAVGRVAAGGA